MKIEARRERNDTQSGGDVVIRTGRRWLRLAAYYGTPPGSHIGFWRTRGGFSGGIHGWNLRVGKRYIGPCLTAFVHTRPRRAR
ncbi:hypothetical protein OOJ91_12155 [Micromonospora lupini]|uniref:hypothetical protein n=1 Tax=Micromonospora lupini TaxID=285679 RepID=UPI002253E243|nr:hypothetical protein [Micromonospora lupini]MCX5066631.1 hypothetical protein [Micromonospora lupini]